MRNLTSLWRAGICALALFSLRPCLSAPQLLAPSVEAQARTTRNIGIFFDKLRAGKSVTVAYLGGSVTAGNVGKNTYRAHVTAWLQQNFQRAQIQELNASIAGTGLFYGAMRVRRDVIAYKPDLVFIEFAVPETNDAPETEEGVKRALEGMLRQLLIVPQPPQIVLLYASNAHRAARVEWFETLAAHYQLPSVNLQDSVWRAIHEGRLKPALLWPSPSLKDGALQSDEAHKTYADFITDFLAAQAQLPPAPLLKFLPNPLVSDEMNYGELKALAEFKHDAAWRKETNHDRALPATLLTSAKPKAQIELYFEGSVLGLSYRVGPDGGVFECLIDGRPAPAPLNRIDTYDANTRIQTRLIPGGLLPGEHKLTLRLLNEKHAKSSGNVVRLGSLMVGGQRPERL